MAGTEGTNQVTVPFFRVEVGEDAIASVADTIRSGWLTSGPSTRKFESEFACTLGASHAIALNSCTAALHLVLEALDIQRGDLVIVPTMSFAATAEVVRYFDALPVFVDCEDDFNLDPDKLEDTLEAIARNEPVAGLQGPYGPVRAIIPIHYGGYCCDMARIMEIARRRDIPVVEDAAHAFLSAYRPTANDPWTWAGRFGAFGCFSFYANKCITTGEGGMVITEDEAAADRINLMSLHGMDRDAWKRFTAEGSWYYEIAAPGFKYNMTDMAGVMGLHQLAAAQQLRQQRERVALMYNEAFADLDELVLPPHDPATHQHSWHLYSIRLNLDALAIDRARFIDELKQRGVNCSVHWNPLHRMPYYRDTYGYRDGLFPVAESLWWRQVSLPIFPSQRDEEITAVQQAVRDVAIKHRR